MISSTFKLMSILYSSIRLAQSDRTVQSKQSILIDSFVELPMHLLATLGSVHEKFDV